VRVVPYHSIGARKNRLEGKLAIHGQRVSLPFEVPMNQHHHEAIRPVPPRFGNTT